jgi:phospholipid/cholesterol/gamma-HCH transport system substrate-binding protein
VRHVRPSGISPFWAGLISLIVVVAIAYLAFAQAIPFVSRGYELKAVFQNAVNIQPRSPVRIAGVEVGKVTKVEPKSEDGSNVALVTMHIDDEGLPVHRDAELKIRPRIFLEGNAFVDLKPGTPSAPALDSGSTIPASQTASPVQLDQVLTTLQSDARADLQRLVKGFGGALSGEPAQAEDRTQDPEVRGKTAAQALNRSLEDSPEALRGSALVNDALQGTELHDLSRLIAGQQKVSAALVAHEDELKDLITSFNLTTAAFASRQDELRSTVHLLPQVLEAAGPALDRLNAAFPPTRAFAREVLPGVRETPATIDASFPWIAQTRRLVSPAELQGLVNELRPAVRSLSSVVDDSIELLPQIDLVDRCALDVVLPTGDVKIQDGPLTTGIENYKEFWQALVGLSGESQNFDGNGQYTRFQPGGGSQTISTGSVGLQGPLFGNATSAPLGTRPAFPRTRPPYNRDVPCYRNTPPDLNSARTGGGG